MGVHEGQSQLNKAYKELNARWQQTLSDWNDPVSKAFAEKYLLPIEHELRMTGKAMDQMSRLLSQIKSECT